MDADLRDVIGSLQPTHINTKDEYQEFVMQHRPGRQRYNLFEEVDFKEVYEHLAKQKKICPVF